VTTSPTPPTPATQDNSPGALVVRYRNSFVSMLPSHLREADGGDTWIASVESVLRTNPQVRQAASNDTGAFMAALVPAAQRGLTPGTEEFYLVPFSPKKGAPRIVQGIIGYQGLVELIYRAGAVSSVICEVVKKNDQFSYRPGADERPQHEVDWFGGDRGDLIGAYAYAVMKDGATSKVVVIGPDEIAKAKAKSASARSDYSPWNTNPEAMWLKTAARQLAKWVPTSAEFRRQALRDAQAVMDERIRVASMTEHLAGDDDLPIATEDGQNVDPVTGEVVVDIVDAELVDGDPK
jgi:recombination protein RecT